MADKYNGSEATSKLVTLVSGKISSLEKSKQSKITSGSGVPSGGVEGDVYIQTVENMLASLGITASASELNRLDGATVTTEELNYIDGVTSNIQTQLDDRSLKGTSYSNGALVQLWKGSSKTPSFTSSDALTDFKYFLVRPGTSSSIYNVLIPSYYTTAAASGVFRGMTGFDSSSAGSEIYTMDGTVSGNTVSITRCYYRTSNAMTTNNQCYVREIYGVK